MRLWRKTKYGLSLVGSKREQKMLAIDISAINKHDCDNGHLLITFKKLTECGIIEECLWIPREAFREFVQEYDRKIGL